MTYVWGKREMYTKFQSEYLTKIDNLPALGVPSGSITAGKLVNN
jgi:hypothetical protein